MPRYNKRNKSNFRRGGAVWMVEVLLAANEPSATDGAGWYGFAHTSKSAVEKMLGREIVKNETGEIIANRPKTKDAKLKVTLQDTSTGTLKLLDALADTAHRYRIAYDTADATKVQLFGFRNAYVIGDWGFEGEDGKDRTLDVEIHASTDSEGNPAMVYDDVLVADETGWPVALADFKTAAAP